MASSRRHLRHVLSMIAAGIGSTALVNLVTGMVAEVLLLLATGVLLFTLDLQTDPQAPG